MSTGSEKLMQDLMLFKTQINPGKNAEDFFFLILLAKA